MGFGRGAVREQRLSILGLPRVRRRSVLSTKVWRRPLATSNLRLVFVFILLRFLREKSGGERWCRRIKPRGSSSLRRRWPGTDRRLKRPLGFARRLQKIFFGRCC